MSETITAHADPEGEAPWALQLVVRVEKNTPPTHAATLEAVARTVVLLLDSVDRPADPNDPAREAAVSAIARWRQGRIRKVVRRARGAAWDNSQLPGSVTHTFAGVDVRAFLPGPVDQVPAEVRKLQVSGLDLTDPEDRPAMSAPVTIWLNPRVRLSTGKAAAQVGHAAQLVYETADSAWRERWARSGAPLRVLTPTLEEWPGHAAVANVSVTDAGFTEVEPGTLTCVATITCSNGLE